MPVWMFRRAWSRSCSNAGPPLRDLKAWQPSNLWAILPTHNPCLGGGRFTPPITQIESIKRFLYIHIVYPTLIFVEKIYSLWPGASLKNASKYIFQSQHFHFWILSKHFLNSMRLFLPYFDTQHSICIFCLFTSQGSPKN